MVTMTPLLSFVCLVVISLSAAQETTVVPGCYIRQADIVFLLDSSNSEGAANFEKQKDFVSTFANSLTIGPDDIQMSVVTFESDIHNQFNLDTYENKTDLLNAIKNISFIAGNTLTEKALNFVRTVSFTNSSGDRENVDNILVVLTDGHSTDRNLTMDEAEMLHNTSTKVITIGIGADIDAVELSAIASEPSNAFTVPDFDALSGIQNAISAKACVIIVPTTTPAPTTPTTTEPPCNVTQADIVFLLDTSNSLGQVNFDRQKQFVLDVVNALDIGQDGTQVGITVYQTDIFNVFQLKDFQNKLDMKNSIKSIQFNPGNTFTDKALKYAREVMFQPANGDRPDVRDVLILMTDGQSSDQNETIKESEQIHNTTQIDVITIGVGNAIDTNELLTIASRPSYALSVDDYSELNSIIAELGFQTTGCIITVPSRPSTTPTTATIPTTEMTTTPTTTAPVDLDCNKTVADILFLIDASRSVTDIDFQQEKDFTSAIIQQFTTDPKDVQVAFGTFSSEVHTEFLLNEFYNVSEIVDKISNIVRSAPGISMPSLALEFVERVFTPDNGDRENATDIVFLIGGGDSVDSKKAEKVVQRLREKNITIITFSWENSTELESIASPSLSLQPENMTDVTMPSKVKQLMDEISGLVPCPTTTVPTTTPTTTTTTTTPAPTTTTPIPTTTIPPACSKIVADVLFLVDSSNSVNSDRFETEKNFTSEVIKQFTIGPDDVQIAYVTFETVVHSQFLFNTYNNSDDVIDAVMATNYTPGNTYTDEALKYAREQVFTTQNGDRPDVSDIIILMSDGEPTLPDNTRNEADLIKANNITIVTFAISGDNSQGFAELQEIASPTFAVNTSFTGLISKVTGLADVISSLSLCPTTPTTVPPSTTVKPCYAPEADIVFLMDSSNSLGPDNWDKEKQFVMDLISNLDVGADAMQVSLVTYESNPKLQFYLNDYQSKDDALAAVSNVTFHTGNTMTGKALKFVNDVVFVDSAGDRPNANNILVLLTDGESSDSKLALEQAELLKNESVKIFVVGVGLDADGKSEAEAIATDLNHVFETPDFFNLSSLQLEIELTEIDCNTTTLPPVTTVPTTTPTTTPTPDCDQRRADIIFVLDSSNSEGLANFNMQLDFVKNFSRQVQIGPDHVLIGVVTFESREYNEFDLNENLDSADLINAISSITYKPGNTFTGKALALVNNHSLSADAGNRPDANDIVIVMTDGQSTDRNETLEEAALLKSAYPDLDIFAIGIGAGVDKAELDAIATDSANNVFLAPNFQFIAQILPVLGNSTCFPTETTGSDCDNKMADVVFLLDSSTTEGQENFQKQLQFISLFADLVNIDVNHVLISVITYSSNPTNQFYLNTYPNRYALKQAIMNIPFVPGNTFTDYALKLARENSFLPKNGGRPGVDNVIILLTDGESTDPNATVSEAELVHNSTDNITVYTIGIGSYVDRAELEVIATDDNSTFFVDDFAGLNGVVDAIGKAFCNATTTTTEPAPTTSTENPRTTAPITAPTVPNLPTPCAYKKVDMIFLLDTSNSEGPNNFAIQKNFVYNVAQNFDIGLDAVRVGLVTFASNVFNQFNLSTYDTRSDVLQSISKVAFTPGNTITEAALKFVREESFTPEAGDRPDVGNVLVVLTDGQSTDKNETIEEAIALHNTSTKVISIGIGAGVDASEIVQIASDPSLAYTVADFNALKGIQVEVEKSACVDAIVCEDNEDCESLGPAICMRFDGWARKNCAKYCEYCKVPQ